MTLDFYKTVSAAVADLAEHGFDSQERVDRWLAALRAAARRSFTPEAVLEERLREALRAEFRRLVERGGVLKHHPGVSAFRLSLVAPRLHAELDRRIAAARDLIVLNREQAMAMTERRLQGWASSLPPGGSRATDKADEAATVRKAMASLPFEERRVAIDQSHKLFAAISDVVAQDNGAVAATWYSHYRQPGYDFDPAHAERMKSGAVWLVRDSWAQKAGFVKPQKGVGYTDEVDQPAQRVYCRCRWQYVYALRRLPEDMLTARGKMELNRTREMAA